MSEEEMFKRLPDFMQGRLVRAMSDLPMIAEYTEDELREIESPPITFPSHWQVKLRAPCMGAPMRFSASIDNFIKTRVSVYADYKDILGCMQEPYWEMYPCSEGDTERFYINEVDELLKSVDKSLASQLKVMENKDV